MSLASMHAPDSQASGSDGRLAAHAGCAGMMDRASSTQSLEQVSRALVLLLPFKRAKGGTARH